MEGVIKNEMFVLLVNSDAALRRHDKIPGLAMQFRWQVREVLQGAFDGGTGRTS